MKELVNNKFFSAFWWDHSDWDFSRLSNGTVIIDVGRLQIRIGR